MKAQRQADSVAAVATQSMSARALLRGVSRERLTNGVRSASVAGMKTLPNTGGAVAVAGQPDPSAVLLRGAAGERSASGVRWASVAGLKKREAMQNTGLVWLHEPADRAARSMSNSVGMRKECLQSAEGFRGDFRSGVWLARSVSLARTGQGFSLVLISRLSGFVFLLLSKASALILASTFGDCRSMRAVVYSALAEGRDKNISVRCGGEGFVSSIFISNL